MKPLAVLCLLAIGAQALPTNRAPLPYSKTTRTLRLSGGSPLLSKSTVFDVAAALFAVEVITASALLSQLDATMPQRRAVEGE